MAVWAAWNPVDKCHGFWRRGVCIFGVGDLPQLLERHELFANKFYFEREHLTLLCLNEYIEFKAFCKEPDQFYDFYRALPFVRKTKR